MVKGSVYCLSEDSVPKAIPGVDVGTRALTWRAHGPLGLMGSFLRMPAFTSMVGAGSRAEGGAQGPCIGLWHSQSVQVPKSGISDPNHVGNSLHRNPDSSLHCYWILRDYIAVRVRIRKLGPSGLDQARQLPHHLLRRAQLVLGGDEVLEALRGQLGVLSCFI